MIIENPEAFTAWLQQSLANLCDADPVALAKYVMALVKKDKTEKELKEFCCDQLDIFLSNNTRPFVEHMFFTLKSQSYLKPSAADTYSYLVPFHVTATIIPATVGATACVPPAVEAVRSDLNPHSLEKPHTPLSEKSQTLSYVFSPSYVPSFGSFTPPTNEEGWKNPPSADKELTYSSPKYAYSPGGSLTFDNPTKGDILFPPFSSDSDNDAKGKKKLESPSPDKEIMEGSSRPSSQRSRSPSCGSNASDHTSRDSRGRQRGASGKSSHNRSSQKMRANETNKRDHGDRCMRERERERERKNFQENDRRKHGSSNFVRSRSPITGNSASSDGSRSRSRSWSRSRTRQKDRSQSDSKGHDSAGIQNPSHHGDVDYRVEVAVSNSNHPTAVNNDVSKQKAMRRIGKRCKDYDEKGYCMQGELCMFDHGTDPLVVDEASVLDNFGTSSKMGTSQNYLPNAGTLPVMSSVAPPPPVIMHTPLPLPVPMFNPNQPPPPFHGSRILRTRELIGVPTLDDNVFAGMTSGISTANISATCDMPPTCYAATNTTNATNIVSSAQRDPPFYKKKSFDHSRLGTRRLPNKRNDRCILELRKVPEHLNTSASLKSHFSKFGNVKLCVTRYDNDPEAALVVFETNTAANAAYRNPDAIFNNRFIRVFWHNPDSRSSALLPLMPTDSGTSHTEQQSVRDYSPSALSPSEGETPLIRKNTPLAFPEVETLSAQSSREYSCIIPSKSEMTYINPISKPELQRPVDASSGKAAAQKSVYIHPSLLKKRNYPSAAAGSSRSLKENHQKDNAFKQRYDIVKKMQSMLQCHLENQKLFLEKLANSKSEAEKDVLRDAIENLDRKIPEVKEELKKEYEAILNMFNSSSLGAKSSTSKTETEKQLLDAEMDLYKMQHTGDDVTELLQRVHDLKQQAMGLLETRNKSAPSVRRFAAAFRGRGSRNMTASRCVDHRTRKLRILNVNDADGLKSHFSQFGAVECCSIDSFGTVVTFKTRKAAEMAFAHGSRYGTNLLNMQWFEEQPNPPPEQTSNVNIPESAPASDAVTYQNRLVELDDDDEDEEEEDSEARSWRR